jgi:sterol desaturase/sphingolipid hydroxylase (fatty acid hydroxylase superfamily)
MNPIFEAWLREQAEPLTYAAFFGALIILAALERVLAARPSEPGAARRLPANYGLTALNILVLGALPLSGLAVADFAQAQAWGMLNGPALPPLVAIALGFVARSLISYGVHVAMHKVPLLWRVHRVHHSDTALDVSTTVRFHPLEFVISTPPVLLAIFLLGIPPAAVILYEIFDAAMAVFTHANLRLPDRLERALRLALVTPAMHRIHHSTWQPETDSNYGATLSWWDRLFGTLRTRSAAELAAMELGLAEWRDARTRSLWWLLALPFHLTPDRIGATVRALVPSPSPLSLSKGDGEGKQHGPLQPHRRG